MQHIDVFAGILFPVFLFFTAIRTETDVCSQSNLCENEQASVNISLLITQAHALASQFSTDFNDFVRLYVLVDQIRSKQVQHEFFRPLRDRSEQLEDLRQFCADQMTDGLEISVVPGYGFGVLLTRDLPASSWLFTIHFNKTLTSAMGRLLFGSLDEFFSVPEDTAPVDAYDMWTGLIPWAALHIASEKLKPNSYWMPYFNTLPSNFGYTTFFRPEELAFLRGSRVFSTTVMTYQGLVVQYAQIYNFLSNNKNSDYCTNHYLCPETFTFDLYRWAYHLGYSRSYAMQNTLVVPPCWSMINHGPNLMQSDIFFELKSKEPLQFKNSSYLRAKTVKALKKGEQLFMEYSSGSISAFFQSMGIIDPNSNLLFQLTLQPSDTMYRIKRTTLAIHNLPLSKQIILTQAGDLPIDKIAYHYLVGASTGNTYVEVRQRSWRRVWIYLARKIAKAIKRYQFSSVEAQYKLEHEKPNDFQQHALLVVIAEQKALERLRLACIKLANGPMQQVIEPAKPAPQSRPVVFL